MTFDDFVTAKRACIIALATWRSMGKYNKWGHPLEGSASTNMPLSRGRPRKTE